MPRLAVRSRCCRWGLALLLALLLPGHAAPQTRERVEVAFRLIAGPLLQQYSEVERQRLHALAAQQLAGALGQQLRFISFAAAGQDAGPQPAAVHRLELVLASTQPPTGATELRLRLLRTDGALPVTLGEHRLPFRAPERAAEPPGSVEALATEVSNVVRASGMSEWTQLFQDRLPIARGADLWKNPMGWVLPLDRRTLCLDDATVLLIKSRLATGAGDLARVYRVNVSGDFGGASAPASWRGRLFAEMPPEAVTAELREAAPENVQVDGVYVVVVKPLLPCERGASPQSVSFTGVGR